MAKRKADGISIPQNLPLGPVSRTMGPVNSREILGAGFMHKNRILDHTDYTPGFYSLIYVIRGDGEYIDRFGRTYELHPGYYFQRFPGLSHSNTIKEGADWWECFIDLGPALTGALVRMNLINLDQPVGRVGLSQDWVDEFAAILEELCDSADYSLPGLLPKMLDLHRRVLSAGRSDDDSGTPEMIRKACLMLGRNLDSRFDLRAFCRENGWGYERFRKEFQAAVGVPPGHYRIRCRMDSARNLLKAMPDLPLSEIANNLGYSSQYEFSSQFKKYTGIPPRKFRKNA